MKCESTDLEIETIVNRIKNEDMDLQPDFQRGEIWTLQKKQKLIDSILRGWKIPPIHVIHSADLWPQPKKEPSPKFMCYNARINNR